MVPESDEAELRVMITKLYKDGGANEVLACVKTMQQCIIIILKKLKELMSEEGK